MDARFSHALRACIAVFQHFCAQRVGFKQYDLAAGFVLRIGLVMLQGARHVHMAALNAAAKDSGIEIEIHELRLSLIHISEPTRPY